MVESPSLKAVKQTDGTKERRNKQPEKAVVTGTT
jgi:hypothetical protein